MKLNIQVIINVIGILLVLLGGFMLACLGVSAYFGEDLLPFGMSSALAIGIGVVVWAWTLKCDRTIKRREGYLIVSLGWLVLVCFGSMPYILSGHFPDIASAFFESMSGLTTTGATVLVDIEKLPYGVSAWRNVEQWIGGMGIIVLTVAILPILGIGGMQLFVAESPGPSTEKLHPRIKDTANRFWLIYFGLTLLLIVLLKFGGMNFFDAITHSMSTVATGGFSPKNASIGHYDSAYIEYIVTLFMLICGSNFVLIYFLYKGNWRKVIQNEEWKVFIGVVAFLTVVVGVILYREMEFGFERSFRAAIFQIVSIITTSGFCTEDYHIWPVPSYMIIFGLMFLGASSGSTSGGVKLVRHLIMFKNNISELRKLIHPNAVIPVRYNGRSVKPEVIRNVLAFFLLYLFIFANGTLIMSFTGMDIITATASTAACLGNVGPAMGETAMHYETVTPFGKVFLAFLMLIGRLELFTVILLLSPYFWSGR